MQAWTWGLVRIMRAPPLWIPKKTRRCAKNRGTPLQGRGRIMAEKAGFGLHTERYGLHAKWPGLLPKLRRPGELDDRTAMGRGLDGQRYGVALKVVNWITVAKFDPRCKDNIDFVKGCGLEPQTRLGHDLKTAWATDATAYTACAPKVLTTSTQKCR